MVSTSTPRLGMHARPGGARQARTRCRRGALISRYPKLQALIDASEHELLVDAIIELEQLEYASTEELDKYDLDD